MGEKSVDAVMILADQLKPEPSRTQSLFIRLAPSNVFVWCGMMQINCTAKRKPQISPTLAEG